MAALLLYALIVGMLLGVAALALEAVCRIVRLPTRWPWIGALLLTGAITGTAPYRARIAARTAVIESEAGLASSGADEAGSAMVSDLTSAVFGGPSNWLKEGVAALQARIPAVADTWILIAMVAASIATLVTFAFVFVRLHRKVGRWPRVSIAGTPARLSHGAGPAVVGLFPPEIVIPARLLARGPEEQKLVIAHESEHIRARDPHLLAMGCALGGLLAWNFAAWWMLSRLRHAVEIDCDSRVIQAGAQPELYGSLLIDLAGWPGPGVGVAALANNSLTLHRRLRAMEQQRQRFPRTSGLTLLVASLAAFAAACETPLPTETDIGSLDVRAAEAEAERIALLAPTPHAAEYTIDGAQATAGDAHALKPPMIESVEIVRATTVKPALIRIRTREDGNLDTTALSPPASEKARPGTGARFAGLVLIDGTRVGADRLRSLAPAQIESVEVIKGRAATLLYSESEAVHGVIRITTKKTADND